MVLGPCALLLSVALIEPGWSQAKEQVPAQVIAAETRSERNWQAFWRNHLGDWRGRWTRYTPSGEIKETFATHAFLGQTQSKQKLFRRNTIGMQTDVPSGRSGNTTSKSTVKRMDLPIPPANRCVVLLWTTIHLSQNICLRV